MPVWWRIIPNLMQNNKRKQLWIRNFKLGKRKKNFIQGVPLYLNKRAPDWSFVCTY